MDRHADPRRGQQPRDGAADARSGDEDGSLFPAIGHGFGLLSASRYRADSA